MTAALPERVTQQPARFASPIDAYAFGEHRPQRSRVGPHFTGRLTADGSSGYRAEPGRYHLYAGKADPRSHRATLAITLTGLNDAVSVSFVDGLRDGRGWAFRERTGADPVNGFTLLSQAYAASQPDYHGTASIPVLWDKHTAQIVSNDPDAIDVDLATAFAVGPAGDSDLYPHSIRDDIDNMGKQATALHTSISRAVYNKQARRDLTQQFHNLDRSLAARAYLTGESPTLADVRLWVILVRYDVGPNATGAAGPPLTHFDHISRYIRRLYSLPAFRSTTDFTAFAAPLTRLPDWSNATAPTAK